MSATPATRTAAEEVLQIVIDLHAAVDARIKVCPVLVLAATFIFRTLGTLRDGLAALVGRVPGRATPRRRKRRPPPQRADTAGATAANTNAAGAATTGDCSAGASPAGATAATASAAAGNGNKARPRKPRRWPSKYRAIADLIGDDAAAIRARLRALLADPEARAYMRANPAFAGYLRPICRGFHVRLIPELRRKPAFRFDEHVEEFEETPAVEPEAPSPIESIAEPAPAAEPEPPPEPLPPTPQPSPVLPPLPPMYGIGPPDWTPTDPGPSMKERVDRWLARQRALGRI